MSNINDFVIEDGVLKKYTGAGGDVIIPDSVTRIGDFAFWRCKSLTTVTIPDSVTSIGDFAFKGCKSLTTGTIPDGITSIGDSAFFGCESLTNITIPDSVTSIGAHAFEGCKSLANITIPDSVTSIGSQAFYKCESLQNEEGFVFIRDVLYYYNGTASEISIPYGIKNIDNHAFDGCESIITIKIPDGVTSIGKYAFSRCQSLTTITIPDGVTSIGGGAFSWCKSLTTVTIPDSVTSIGDGAFYECKSLTTITIHNGVTSIGDGAFFYCESLTTVTIPDSVTSIGDHAFYYCGSLTTITIPDSVTTILHDTFHGCKSLTTVTIPDSVTSIGDHAFSSCESLTNITIPDGVTSIGAHAFNYCESLTTITIPVSVTSIGDEAFSYCESLTTITIPDSVTSIGDRAFYECKSLTNITIPDSVTKIGQIFGDSFPKGLIEKFDELSRFMNAEGIKKCIIPDYWKLLSYASKACIFLTYQDAKMKKAYKKMFKPSDLDPLSEAILCRLGSELSKKECDIVAQFMLDYTAYLSDYALKKMYDKIAVQRKGVAALKLIDGNAGLKKKIASAPTERRESIQIFRTEYDVLFDNMGFDANGIKIYNLGNKELQAVLQPDLNILVIDTQTGKTSKSIPKRGADPELYNAAASDFKAVVKAVNKITQTCRDILFSLYLSAEEITVKKWKEDWTGNPITLGLASMVVWQQGNAFFSLDKGTTVDADGNKYILSEENIRVAHIMDMDAAVVLQWQKFFNSRLRKQPFLQIWELNRCVEDIKEDRYKNCTIRSVYLLNKSTMGIKAEWYNQEMYDGDVWKQRYLKLEGFEIEASGNDDGEELEISRIVPVLWNRRSNAIISYLDRITVYGRIAKDDMSVNESLPQYTMAQIVDFINVANENNATNILSLLLDYKNKNFADFDPMEEFVLD
ncbi:MAG: leucine-rich repeat protein [Clostridia bacterium]|nr:leucine-rich repeat protein [Clostridia bacterium]